MKTRIISILASVAVMLLSGCTHDTMPGGADCEGNRVEFTLAGITPAKGTRATGNNDTAKPDASAAIAAEKEVTSLLAVTYEKQSSGNMGFYRTFEVTVTPDGCSFDIAKDGRFDIYLVANADSALSDALKGLDAGSAVSDFEEQIVSQAPDAANAFLMTSPEAIKVISYSGEVADCGEVSLRRLSVRIDLLNKADGLTINKVTFHNRVIKSQLMTPNAMISTPDLTEDKLYDNINLVGNFTTPAEYKSTIYSYENLSRTGDATVPTLDVEYTLDGQTYTHTVKFIDANDPDGVAPLALKRNYLYRITVGRKIEPEFNIEVLDWTNGESFNIDEIPFQAQMNAKLAINNFASANVATLEEGVGGEPGTVTFTTSSPNTTSKFFAWNNAGANALHYNAPDNSYYRVPTKAEMYLFFPDTSLSHVVFATAEDGSTEVSETLPTNLFDSTTANGGEGKSIFKNAPAGGITRASALPDYPIVYAIRFRGTVQCAAYRYEVKDMEPTTGYLEIRIKALQPNTLMTIDDVADEAYWGNPGEGDNDAENQLIYTIPATGYIPTADAINQGTHSYLWTATEAEDGANAYLGGHGLDRAHVVSSPKTYKGTLRLVKTSNMSEQAKLNAALKVNMFTPYNVKEVDLSGKTITSFYDNLTVKLAECPASSYISFEELDAAGAVDATFTGPDGHHYRIPTGGELALLSPQSTNEYSDEANGKKGYQYPYWNDNASTASSTYTMCTTPFTETIYLKNQADHTPDMSHPDDTDSKYTLKGESQLKWGPLSETIHYYTGASDDSQKYNYNLRPVYGLRFKGTSQYAAYRWESVKIADDPLERYMSIKIKALRPDDTLTTIDMVADESFWQDGYIEFRFPGSGYYGLATQPDATDDKRSCALTQAYAGSSTKQSTNTSYAYWACHYNDTNVSWSNNKFPLRFVRVD